MKMMSPNLFSNSYLSRLRQPLNAFTALRGVAKLAKTPKTVGLLLLLGCGAVKAETDCVRYASQCFQVNPLLIRAIIWQESRFEPRAINHNSNRTRDIGLMQINTVNLPMLNTLGVNLQNLRENSCVNVMSGTYILHTLVQRYGYSWNTIGRYHSATPRFNNVYVNKLLDTLTKPAQVANIRAYHVPIASREEIDRLFASHCLANKTLSTQ